MKILNCALVSLTMFLGTNALAVCPSDSDKNFHAFPESLDVKFNYHGSASAAPNIDFHLASKAYIPAGQTGTFWMEYKAYVRGGPTDLYSEREQRSANFDITSNPLGMMLADTTLFSDEVLVRSGQQSTSSFEFVVTLYKDINGGAAPVFLNSYNVSAPNNYNIKKHTWGSYNEVNGDEFFGCNHKVTQLLQFDFPPNNSSATAFGYGYVKVNNQWIPNSASAAVVETTTGINPEVYFRSLSASAMFPGFDANRGLKVKAEIKLSNSTMKEGSFESNQSKDWLYEMLN